MIKPDLDIFPADAGAYIVGGSIRDLLLDRSPNDYDIAVCGDPAKFAARAAAKAGGHRVEIGKGTRKIIRVVTARHLLDVAAVTGPTIESDLAGRDFSINAMAWHLSTGRIIDPFDGRKDLSRKKIRMVSTAAFSNDPIRLLRAYRLAAALGFGIEPQTMAAIRDRHAMIRQSAGERIRAELFRLFATAHSHPYLIQMEQTGLLTAIFPEMIPLKGCRQNRHHDGDVLTHSLAALRRMEDLIREVKEDRTPADPASDILGPDNPALLKMAALLHDIGKPSVKTETEGGAIHFYGHAEKSADMVQAICLRLKFSKLEMQFLDSIIRNHLRPLALFNAWRTHSLTPKGLARFFLKCGAKAPFLLLHAQADNRAKNKSQAATAREDFIRDLLRRYFAEFLPAKHSAPLITGRDLIGEFKLKPSPRFKTILARVAEAQLSKAVKTRPEALALVRGILNGRRRD